MTEQKKIKVGDVGFGTVNGYPPAHWRFVGRRNGSWILENVRHPNQSVAYPDQGVTWQTVERIMAG